MLASLSSLLRIIKINLRCLAICKIDLEEIITEEEYLSFSQIRDTFDSEFGVGLKAAIKTAAAADKIQAEERTKAKEEQEKAKAEEESKAKAEEESKAKEEEKKKEKLQAQVTETK